MRRLVPLFAVAVLAFPVTSAGPGAASDTTGRDTTRVTQLPELNVTVTRTTEPLERVPFAVGVLDRDELVRGQQTVGIDEALNNLPGVVVANRYNFSLDQRISIRGFGSRSNFGVRGLKILVDGIPQTLPDGQSQLTNVDFANLERAEVLRGVQLVALRQRLGRGDLLPDRARGAGPVRPAGAGAGRRRQARRRRLLQVAELDLGPLGRRERHALDLPVQGRRVPPAQRRRVPAAQRRRRLGDERLDRRHRPAQPGRQSGGGEPRRAHPDRVRRQSRFRRAEQHHPRRGQGRAAAAARPRGEALRRGGQRVQRDGVRPAARSREPARRSAGHRRRPDQRHLRARSIARRAASGSPWRRALGSLEQAPRLTAGVDVQRMRDDRQNLVSDGGAADLDDLPRPAGAGDRAGTVRAAAVDPERTAAHERRAPGSTGSGSASTTTSSPTATTAATATCRR